VFLVFALSSECWKWKRQWGVTTWQVNHNCQIFPTKSVLNGRWLRLKISWRNFSLLYGLTCYWLYISDMVIVKILIKSTLYVEMNKVVNLLLKFDSFVYSLTCCRLYEWSACECVSTYVCQVVTVNIYRPVCMCLGWQLFA
jgi:hypothetical protein